MKICKGNTSHLFVRVVLLLRGNAAQTSQTKTGFVCPSCLDKQKASMDVVRHII